MIWERVVFLVGILGLVLEIYYRLTGIWEAVSGFLLVVNCGVAGVKYLFSFNVSLGGLFLLFGLCVPLVLVVFQCINAAVLDCWVPAAAHEHTQQLMSIPRPAAPRGPVQSIQARRLS